VRAAKLKSSLTREEQSNPFLSFVSSVAKSSGEDRITISAGALAFHGFLSIIPALIAGVALARLVGLSSRDFDVLVKDLTILLPRSASQVLIGSLSSTSTKKADLVAVVVGVLIALWSSVEAMSALQVSVDAAFEVRAPRGAVARRIASIPLLVITIAFGSAAVALLVLGNEIERIVARHAPIIIHPVAFVIFDVGRVLGAMVAIAILISIIYGVSRRKGAGRPKLFSPGSILATVGWIVVSAGYSIYLSDSTGESRTYGSLAGVAILLLWLFVSSLMVLVGAEVDRAVETHPPFTKRWRSHSGHSFGSAADG